MIKNFFSSLSFILPSKATNLSGTLVNSIGQSIASLFQQNFLEGTSDLSIPFPIDFPIGHYFLKLEDSEGGIKSIPLLKI